MKLFQYILVCLHVLLVAVSTYIVLQYVNSDTLKSVLILVFLSFGLMNLANYIYFRKRFTDFTDEVCHCSENILHGKSIKQVYNQETLTSKMAMEMEKIEDIFTFQVSESKKEKKELQEMISEITHQIKTPISNIQMYCEMFSDPDIPISEAKRFIAIMQHQLERLEFLLNILVKSSRLETNMINLEMESCKVVDTLAIAVNQVIQKAQLKNLEIFVACRSTILLCHDMKWTAEAIENVLDNAVKYTPEGGKITISVDVGEMYTEIKIKDTGKGIEAAHMNDIFKRFYREKSVKRVEGLGLGLYIARKIITLQGGYISVQSALGKGSCFSLCLPNRIHC